MCKGDKKRYIIISKQNFVIKETIIDVEKIGLNLASNCLIFIVSISIIFQWHAHHVILVSNKPRTGYRKHKLEMLFLYDGLFKARP